VSSAGGTATIGRATVGNGADESATAGVSADTSLSGCGFINIVMNTRAKPVGNAIHPTRLAAGMMRRRVCRALDLRRQNDRDGGTSPCHTHKPDSLVSALINAAEADIGTFPVTIGALLDAWPAISSGSACMAHNPLLVAAPISRVRSVRCPWTASGRIAFAAAPNRPRWPYPHVTAIFPWTGINGKQNQAIARGPRL
jgi:hypothetical protein